MVWRQQAGIRKAGLACRGGLAVQNQDFMPFPGQVIGGRFRMAMTGPNGVQDTPFGGQYREIVPDRKIVFDNGFESPGAPRMIVTVTLNETGGRTTLTINTLFESVAMKTEYLGLGFEQGFGSGLDQLADVAAALCAQEQSSAG